MVWESGSATHGGCRPGGLARVDRRPHGTQGRGGAAARDLRVRSGVRDQGIRDGARVGQSEGKKKEKMGRAQRNNVIS
jgi:hypothetical protein